MAADPQREARPFRGSAPYYVRGRLPYAPVLADALARALNLDGRGRLLDVGCGPGVVALRLAHLFEGLVGVDLDPDMLAEAERRAKEQGVTHARWVSARAEELPAGLGRFRVATFGRSFHWMDPERVAPAVFDLLEPGGALVLLFETGERAPEPAALRPHPPPPRAAIEELLQQYLGSERWTAHARRLGRQDERARVLDRAGFVGPEQVHAIGRETFVRSADDVIAFFYSYSHAAPHLFGARLAEFEADVRRVLADASPSGLFCEESRDTDALIWRKPGP